MDSHKAEQVETTATASARQWCSPIVELQQDTLHSGLRDVLISLFELAFIEPQEAVGITMIGQFRDLEDPNRFIWLRGFPDMDQRLAALRAFYGGPVWQRYRDVVKSMLADSDNALLLRPTRSTSGFLLDRSLRPPPGSPGGASGLVVATILSFGTPPSADFFDWFEGTLAPVLTKNGASILASFVTEESSNTFPVLPVREGEQVFVWFLSFRGQAAYDQHVAALARSAEWQEQMWKPLVRHLKAAPSVLKLTPTARSLAHG
jgi:hypothetical protein